MKRIIALLSLFLLMDLGAQPKQAEMPAKDSAYVVDLGAFDYAFALPTEIPSGWITFRMKNQGKDTHVAMIGKRPDTISHKEFIKDIENWQWPLSDHMGGPGLHSPGQVSETTVHLEPGDYFVACGAHTPEGVSHTNLGMIRYFKVTQRLSGAKEPIADGTVNLKRFEMDADLFKNAGNKTLKIVHEDYPMDLHLVRLEGKSTIEEAQDFFYDISDPTETKFLGGVEQAEPGRVSYLNLDIAPGEYALMSHEYSAWGMKQPFKVLESGEVVKQKAPIQKEEPSPVMLKVGNEQIAVPEKIEPGIAALELKSVDSLSHSIAIFRMKEGKDFEDLTSSWNKIKKYWETYEDTGEMIKFPTLPDLGHAFAPNLKDSNTQKVELIPGRYLVLCYEKDEEGNKHYDRGENKIFIIDAGDPASGDAQEGK